ncbi:MAG: hypothetical protein Q8N95_01975 [Desulfobacterales bacterium]|nr:hypothetical protein [Desulfobacterales bacterium]
MIHEARCRMQDARKRRCPENPFSFSLNTVYDEPVKNFVLKAVFITGGCLGLTAAVTMGIVLGRQKDSCV